MNITKSFDLYEYDNYFPLFGSYKGLDGGHSYGECYDIFDGDCKSDDSHYYCDDGDYPLERNKCYDFHSIPAFNYSKFDNEYYYAIKGSKDFSYEYLKNNTVKEGEKCPNNKKKCGYLMEGLILCLGINEVCPINDIIINEQTHYSYNNIEYETISFRNKYNIHFTNQNTNNLILFDLLFSIEHPLSKIEIREELYNKIFQLHKRENHFYFNGSINEIKVYKQLYNTGETLKQLLQSLGYFNDFKLQPDYKTECFYSKIFIYKKYTLPFPITLEQVEDVDDKSDRFFICSYICSLIFLFLFFPNYFYIYSNYKWKKYHYIAIIIGHLIIIFTFFLNIQFINSEILKYFPDKNLYKNRQIYLYLSYFILIIIQNINGPISNKRSFSFGYICF